MIGFTAGHFVWRTWLHLTAARNRYGKKITYGYTDWPSFSVWIIPGTITETAA